MEYNVYGNPQFNQHLEIPLLRDAIRIHYTRALRKLIGSIIIYTIAACYQAEKKTENYDI
jgi:hypothetical protein